MAVMEKTVRAARRLLEKRWAILETIGGIYCPAATALFLVRESGDDEDALTDAVVDSWEVGATLRTVHRTTGAGTAKTANVDPLDRVSSYYGLQYDFAACWSRWVAWLQANGFDPPDEAAERLTLIHLPYSVGWFECRLLMLAGRERVYEEMPDQGTANAWVADPIKCLAECLLLTDAQLPDPGPQTDETIRMRIRKALDLPADVRKVGPLTMNQQWTPARLPAVKPFPRWLGRGGLRERLRAIATERGLKVQP